MNRFVIQAPPLECVVVKTRLGLVVLEEGVDYAGRETLRVGLEPVEGVGVDHRHFVREHVPEQVPVLRKGEARKALRQVKDWLMRPQPDKARYRSHFGVHAPDVGRCRLQVRPGGMTIELSDQRSYRTSPKGELAGMSGRLVNPLTDQERKVWEEALRDVFGHVQTWSGRSFVSCFFPTALAHPSHHEAMRRYNQRLAEYVDLELPKGWLP